MLLFAYWRHITGFTLGLSTMLGVPAVCPAQEKSLEQSSTQATSLNNNQSPRDFDLSAEETVGFELQFPAMGTLVQLKTFATSKAEVEAGFSAAQRRVQEIAKTLTDYDSDSETRQLSQSAVDSPQQVSADLWAVLNASDEWYQKTEGRFDSSLGSLTRLWRKYRRARRIPEADLVHSALQDSGWNHVQLDANGHTIQFSKAGIALDFGGIGKGYIVDEAFGVLLEHGLPQSLVNISGNMRLGTAPPNRDGWKIEVAPVEASGKPIQRLALSECSIATSGDLWQFIEIDGVRRSHILDPKTGFGVPGPISATVITKHAIDADALATAACILPTEQAIELCEQQKASCLVAQRQGGKLRIARSAAFPSPLEPNSKESSPGSRN
ncbi:MAG: FAD:protein FMN transferase [Planctomycetota bacterium]